MVLFYKQLNIDLYYNIYYIIKKLKLTHNIINKIKKK